MNMYMYLCENARALAGTLSPIDIAHYDYISDFRFGCLQMQEN